MVQICRVKAVSADGVVVLTPTTNIGEEWIDQGVLFEVRNLTDAEKKFLAKNLGEIVKYEATFVDVIRR